MLAPASRLPMSKPMVIPTSAVLLVPFGLGLSTAIRASESIRPLAKILGLALGSSLKYQISARVPERV